MKILSGYDLYKGKTAEPDVNTWLNSVLPIQMIPSSEKSETWVATTMNFIEWQGIRQIWRNLNWMNKNYNLARGIIDRSDYIREETEYDEVLEVAARGEEIGALDLKFYPLAPIIVDVLANEGATRQSKLTFSETGTPWETEMLEAKKEEVEQVLLQQVTIKQQMKMMQMGLSADSEQGQQMLDPNTIKSLPEIQKFYTKSYKSIYQDWAEHQMNFDNDRFYMPEQERLGFWESLVVDRCFWHFPMMENDYRLERWNPKQTFYRKSPNQRWISEGMWVGQVDLMTVSETIDRYGWMMSEEQFERLNQLYPARSANYILDGQHPDNMYDPSMPYEWNRTGPGVATRQLMSMIEHFHPDKNMWSNGDVVNYLFAESEDMQDFNVWQLVRISTIYWKTQRRIGFLSKVDEQGNLIQEIVSEEYKVTDKPMYNTVSYKEKSKVSLIFGEHIDWMWANEVWGGIKIGPNLPVNGMLSNQNNWNPIYLGMNGGKPGRIPFQFIRDGEIWNPKLPVEGAVFSDYNTRSRSFLDKIKPWQIGFNMMCNLIMDLNVDELGVIIAFDQNLLPKHSLGEDWGKANFQKAYQVMQDFSIMPFDGSRQNLDSSILPNRGIEAIDASQTNRIMSKAKLAEWFQMQALNSVGLNPQRMGQPLAREDTATGINQAVAASYAQTEQYFIQFFDELMPRVHQMRTDLAQWYASTNPSVSIQYTSSTDEKVNFQINGTKLLGRNFGIMCKSRVNARNILKKIEQLLLTNNTAGANLFDLVRGVQVDNLSEMNDLMRSIEQRTMQEQQQKAQQEQQMHQQQLEQEWKMHEDNQQFEAEQNELDRQQKKYDTDVKAASTTLFDTQGSDYQEYQAEMQKIQQGQQQHTDKMNLERDKLITQTGIQKRTLDTRDREIAAENERTNAMLRQKNLDRKSKEKQKKPSAK